GHLIDVRADLFALGVVMYETLTNTMPFGTQSASSVLAAILAGRPPPPTAKLPAPDPAMDALVYKAMAPEPRDRFQTATEMHAALIEYLHDAKTLLPLEEVRRILRAGRPSSAAASDALLEPPPAEEPSRPMEPLGLDVDERCGKCGGRFQALLL